MSPYIFSLLSSVFVFCGLLFPSMRLEMMSLGTEIDISVLKLLGFETFAKSLRVSVSENLVWGKKVSVSVSKKFGLGKKSRSRFRKI